MMRKLSLLALFSLTAGCMAEPGASIQLAHVMAPDQQCDYKVDGKLIRTAGFYDPAGDDKMDIAVRVMNSMNAKDTDARTNDNNTNLRPNGNTVSINGFNICYKQVSDLDEFGSGDAGNALDCDNIINATTGEYKEFVPAGSVVEPDPTGQDTGSVVRLNLFTKTSLQGLFGEGLLPEAVVVAANAAQLEDDCLAQGVGLNDQGQLVADSSCNGTVTTNSSTIATNNNLAQPGVSEVDDWPWGDWALEARPQQRVLVVMQAVGVTTGGSVVKSNWLNFPVDLCMGCTVISTECTAEIEKVICNPGTCTQTNDNGDTQEPCVSPAGRADGSTGCVDGTTACTNFSSALQTYKDVYEGYCSRAQRLGTNVSVACYSEDPCAAE